MYRNVSVFVLLALLASAMGVPTKQEFDAYKEKCIAETGADPEKLTALIDVGPIDDKLKCFGACIMKQLGTMKEDGTFDLEKALSFVTDDAPARDEKIAIITECAANSKKGANDCETAHEIFTCLRETKLPM